MPRKTSEAGGKAKSGTASPAPEASNPFLHPTPAMHAAQRAEILARGEDPAKIALDFRGMVEELARRHSIPTAAPTALAVAGTDDASTWPIGRAIRFAEAVAAGTPVPTDASAGRPARLSDLLHGVDPEGMLLVSVSGCSMTGVHLQDGDAVLVDPKAEPRDGDLVLAHVCGHGQVVKRLRISPEGEATLESENAEFKPIKVSDPSELRIHGKVVWRGGRLS